MKVLITGTSQGIGKAIAERFLREKHTVIGIDRQDASVCDDNYTHYRCDVRDYENLPELTGINILINRIYNNYNTINSIKYRKRCILK